MKTTSILQTQYSATFTSSRWQQGLSGCTLKYKIGYQCQKLGYKLLVHDEPSLISHHLSLWTLSIILLIPCERETGNPVSGPRDSHGPKSSQCWRGQEFPGCWVDSKSGRNAKSKEKHYISTLSRFSIFMFWEVFSAQCGWRQDYVTTSICWNLNLLCNPDWVHSCFLAGRDWCMQMLLFIR